MTDSLTEPMSYQHAVEYTNRMIQKDREWLMPDYTQMRNAPNRPAQYPVIMPDPRQFTNYLPVIPPVRQASNLLSLSHSSDYEGRGRPVKTDLVSQHHARVEGREVVRAATRQTAPKKTKPSNSIFNIKK